MSVFRDVCDFADDPRTKYPAITQGEALQASTKIVEIEAYKAANVLGREKATPALESIAICLGMGGQFSLTDTDAVASVSKSLSRVTTAIESQKKSQD